MRSKAFHLLVASGVLLAFLRGCCGTTDSYQCRYDIHVNKGQIIKAKESVNNGAVFLKHESVNDARLCYRLCCELDNCDLAQMQYKNSSDGYGRIEKICFMFHCGKPSKCSFGEHDHYATISYDRPEEKSKEVKTHNTPTKKVTKPKWNDDKAKTKKVKTKPSVSQECPEGVPVAMCYSDPCLRASCPSNREAICVPSYCGTCHYFFMDSSGTKVDCSGYDEETDLESKPDQSAQPKYKNEPENHDEDKQTSWEEEMEEQNTKYPEETMEPEITKQPEGKKEESSYQEVYMTKKPEIPTKYNQVEPKTQAQEETHEEAEKPDPWESYFGDKDLEHKLEELAPSTQHPSKLPVKVVKTTTKPFHHWREFVDNNPNFPYTIPNIKKTTKRPTTKEPTEKPTTKKPTEKPTTEKLTEKLTPQPTTEAPPPKKTEKLKITDVVPAVEENKQEDATHNHPPILERPVPLKNVSDVVVIETHRLRIIENKAVLPLAIFLVLAILLLFVVALRLRIVKSKLKRRPFATDDADYLINGMYL